jgi:hypothetical protein
VPETGSICDGDRFAESWTVEETDACFIVKDHAGLYGIGPV